MSNLNIIKTEYHLKNPEITTISQTIDDPKFFQIMSWLAEQDKEILCSTYTINKEAKTVKFSFLFANIEYFSGENCI